jgi:PIN domain nuclease of toxin-antitoxin system
MRALLDTHVFLWWVSDDERLSPRARDVIGAGPDEILFSVVSAWEIVLKAALGRLQVAPDPTSFVSEHLQANSFTVLPMHLRHALAVADLPDHHRDPFDRMLIAQARSEGLAIISSDQDVARYPVEVVW